RRVLSSRDGSDTHILVDALHRQNDDELRSFARCALHIDLAAEAGHDAMHHRKTQTRAFADRFGGEERLEHAMHDLGAHAATGVGDAELDPTRHVRWARYFFTRHADATIIIAHGIS